jgi:hypothetical protein
MEEKDVTIFEKQTAFAYGWISSWIQQFCSSLGVPERNLTTRVGTLLQLYGSGGSHSMPPVPQETTDAPNILPAVEVPVHAHRRPRLAQGPKRKNGSFLPKVKCPLCRKKSVYDSRGFHWHLNKGHEIPFKRAVRLARRIVAKARKETK